MCPGLKHLHSHTVWKPSAWKCSENAFGSLRLSILQKAAAYYIVLQYTTVHIVHYQIIAFNSSFEALNGRHPDP